MTGPGATMTSVAETRTYREATRNLLRDTVFQAARAKLETQPWSEITMSDIASGAGVSRQTLYNEFGSRDEFGLAFVLHEAEKFLDGVERSIRAKGDDPRGAVQVALEQSLRAAAEDPMVAILLSDDGTGGMLPFVTTQGLPVVAWLADRIESVICETWPGTVNADANLIATNLVRLAISYVTTPVGASGETASSVGRLLGPFVEQSLVSQART